MATAINDPLLTLRGKSMDLSRLNEAERRVLGLLSEGHTAKSIAHTIGSTPAAVNERLREARRKTGAGSSRELARLLRAQENCDEQIGVGKGSFVAAPPRELDAKPWRRHMGVFAMTCLIAVAAAGLAALMSQQGSPEASNVKDPLIRAALTNDGPGLVILYEKVRSEARDEAWAEGRESAIRRRVMQVPLVGKNGNVLRVTCGNSLCEIAGTVVAPQDKAEPYDQRSRFNRTEKALQGPSLSDDLAKLGLQVDGASFAFGKDKPDQLTFVLYYSRANIRGPSRRLPPLP